MKYSLKRLFENIRFLMKYDLKAREQEQKLSLLNSVEDLCRYEIFDKDKVENQHDYMLDVMGYRDTVDLLLSKNKSFCRIGDGEIELIEGKSIPFQRYNKKLGSILLEILESLSENLYVGINYNYFHSIKGMNETNKKFYLLHAPKYRSFLLKHCNKKNKYIAAGFNQLYAILDKYDYETHYENIKKLFVNRELVIFSGKGILDKLDYDVFEFAKSKEYIEAPRLNAFDEYEELLRKARSVPPHKNIGFYIGTVL